MSVNVVKSVKAAAVAATLSCAAFSAGAADVLRVGTEATYAPFEFMDENAQAIGYDMDIIKAVAAAQGMEVEVRNMGFDALIPSLMTNQIDAAIAAVTITPERAERVDFTEPYYNSGLSVLIRESDQDKYKTLDDLKDAVLCGQIGTTGAEKAAELSGGNSKSYNYESEVFNELKTGGCDGAVNDRPVNLYYLATSHAEGIVEMSEMITSEQYGIAVKKGNQELLDKLNAGLKQIHEDGTFAKIHEKWFSVAE